MGVPLLIANTAGFRALKYALHRGLSLRTLHSDYTDPPHATLHVWSPGQAVFLYVSSAHIAPALDETMANLALVGSADMISLVSMTHRCSFRAPHVAYVWISMEVLTCIFKHIHDRNCAVSFSLFAAHLPVLFMVSNAFVYGCTGLLIRRWVYICLRISHFIVDYIGTFTEWYVYTLFEITTILIF